MGKFDGYLFCTDCDGTLTTTDGEISKENQDAIRYFQSEGGLFTVATGRMPHYITKFKEQVVPNTYVVGCNGTVIYDLKEEKEIFSAQIDADVKSVLHYVHNNIPEIFYVMASSSTEELYDYNREGHMPVSLYADYLKNVRTVKTADDIDKIYIDRAINRLTFVMEEKYVQEKLAMLKAEYGDKLNIMQCWNMGIELQSTLCGKGQMIERMKKIIPNIHTTIGVGDNDNDVSMFKLCDISYAVDNAEEHIKSQAKSLTVSCNDSAIAKIISQL